MKKNDDYIKRAAAVVPSERQLKWHELEFYAFIHFGMNTFTNSEWGNGNDDPVLFNPEKLNANQWAAAVRAAGMKAIILTCKHHDGFCLWPSEYTDYSVKKANGKTDRAMSCANAPKRAKNSVSSSASIFHRGTGTIPATARARRIINISRISCASC